MSEPEQQYDWCHGPEKLVPEFRVWPQQLFLDLYMHFVQSSPVCERSYSILRFCYLNLKIYVSESKKRTKTWSNRIWLGLNWKSYWLTYLIFPIIIQKQNIIIFFKCLSLLYYIRVKDQNNDHKDWFCHLIWARMPILVISILMTKILVFQQLRFHNFRKNNLFRFHIIEYFENL